MDFQTLAAHNNVAINTYYAVDEMTKVTQRNYTNGSVTYTDSVRNVARMHAVTVAGMDGMLSITDHRAIGPVRQSTVLRFNPLPRAGDAHPRKSGAQMRRRDGEDTVKRIKLTVPDHMKCDWRETADAHRAARSARSRRTRDRVVVRRIRLIVPPHLQCDWRNAGDVNQRRKLKRSRRGEKVEGGSGHVKKIILIVPDHLKCDWWEGEDANQLPTPPSSQARKLMKGRVN